MYSQGYNREFGLGLIPYNPKSTQKAILKLLKKYNKLCRNDLVDITGLPRTTIYNSIEVLIEERKIRTFKDNPNKRGRNIIFYKI